MSKRICIVTGSRAEYGLLRPLVKEIAADSCFDLQLIATGMHLSDEYGLTYKQIEQDGFNIDEKVDIGLGPDTSIGIAHSMGRAISGFAEAYERLKPDIVVVLGDRFEIFGVAAAAVVSRLYIAHIHGGERTEGAIDEAFRHSITKMSHLHFTSTETYRQRVIQLGENPDRVFNVGALGLDNIKKLKLLSRDSLAEKLNLKFDKHNLLVTFHPVTLEKNTATEQFQYLLSVLDELEDTYLIFTKANADPDGKVINKIIEEYISQNLHKSVAFVSMGQLHYLSTMRFADAVVGNSSSGIIEAPSFKIGTVNIGDRQKGRIKAESVIDCKPTKKDIRIAIKKLYSKGFQKSLKDTINPYDGGITAKKIKNILKRYNIKTIMKKSFCDIDFEYRR